MKALRVAKYWLAVMAISAIWVIGFSGPTWTQDKTVAGSSVSEPNAKAVASVKPAAPAATATLSVVGRALRPSSSSTTFASYATGSTGTIYAIAGFDTFCTPLYLPQGATITSFRMYYYDADPLNNCIGYIVYRPVDGTATYDLGGISSSGATGFNFVDSGPLNHTVDYTAYNYELAWQPYGFGVNMRLAGFSIFYTPPPTPAKAVVIPLN